MFALQLQENTPLALSQPLIGHSNAFIYSNAALAQH